MGEPGGTDVCADEPRVRYSVGGVLVDAVQIPGAVARMKAWISAGARGQYVAVTGMHGVTEAQHNRNLFRALREASLVVADGTPLVWMGRLRGHAMPRRVYGPELMLTFCRETAECGYRHFLYGGAPGVPERLAERLREVCPGIRIVGTWSPPYRALTEKEEREFQQLIKAAAPDVLWVGLSTPKQEQWMAGHRDLRVSVMVGVGAAFDFHAGRVRQAPSWVREHGLEWLFRLLQEPRRLWRRYLLGIPKFAWALLREATGAAGPRGQQSK